MRSHFSRQKDKDTLLFLGKVSYTMYVFIAIAKDDRFFNLSRLYLFSTVEIKASRRNNNRDMQ